MQTCVYAISTYTKILRICAGLISFLKIFLIITCTYMFTTHQYLRLWRKRHGQATYSQYLVICHVVREPVFGLCDQLYDCKTQTIPLQYRDEIEMWKFACSKLSYWTFQKSNNKGADQTAAAQSDQRLCCSYATNLDLLTARPKLRFVSYLTFRLL